KASPRSGCRARTTPASPRRRSWNGGCCKRRSSAATSSVARASSSGSGSGRTITRSESWASSRRWAVPATGSGLASRSIRSVPVHPEPAAALDKAEADLKARLEAASAKEKPELQKQIDDLQERRRTMLAELETLARMAREGRKVRLPLLDREIRLVADIWAKP